MAPLLLRSLHADPAEVTCSVQPCKDIADDLHKLLSCGKLESYGTWCHPAAPGSLFPAVNPLTILHVLSKDAGPDIRVLEWQGDDAKNGDQDSVAHARAAFAKWHQVDLDQGRCIVFRFPDRDKELVLVPVRIKTGGKSAPGCAYWGFAVSANLLGVVANVLRFSKLVVVFDIDETLLMAHTLDSLQTRLQRIKAERKAKAADLEVLAGSQPGSDVVQQLEAELAAMELEQELLQKDFDMLNFFRTDPACRVQVQGPPGVPVQVFEPSWETVKLAQGGTVTRPVVRLELGGRPVYITRIQPHIRNTSMLIRPRPGWEQLRKYMAGLLDLEATGIRKERWDVYLCTTADREYAWEAWRLLDPQASVFPLDQLAWRMMCVAHPQKKDLLNVLRKKEVDAAVLAGAVPQKASDLQLVTDKARASRPPVGSPAPLCVVVDDRLDVWEEDSRKAVLQVMPFHPHKEAAIIDVGVQNAPRQGYQQALDSEVELRRVLGTVQHVRSSIYQTLDQYVKPEVNRLVTIGVTDQLQSTAASISKHILVPLKSVPQLLAEAPQRPPAALGSTEKDDRASDLRMLVHDGTMEAAANGTGSSTTGQQELPGSATITVAAAAAADARKRRLGAGEEQPVPGMMGPPADRHQQQQQQEQPAPKKQKKEKKRKTFFGDIMNSLQRQPSDGQNAQQLQQQPPLQEEQPMVVDDKQPQQQKQGDVVTAVPATTAAAAAGSVVNKATAPGGGASAAGAAAAALTSAQLADSLKSSSISSSSLGPVSSGGDSFVSLKGAAGAAVPTVRQLAPASAASGGGPSGAAKGTGIRGLAAAAAAAAGLGSGSAAAPAQAAEVPAAAGSSPEQPQLLLGPLSQAFAAPAPLEEAMQLLMSKLNGAAPNSPEAGAAMLELLPQSLKDAVPAEDMWTVLAAVQLSLGSGSVSSVDVNALIKALPPRLEAHIQTVASMLLEPGHEVQLFMLPILSKTAAAVQVGQQQPVSSLQQPTIPWQQQQQQMQEEAQQQQAQLQAVPVQQSAQCPPAHPLPQHQQLQNAQAGTPTPPPSPTRASRMHVVDFRSLGAVQQQQQPQEQQPQEQQQQASGGGTLQWHPLLQSVQGPHNQGGQLGFGALGGAGLPPGLSGPASGQMQGLPMQAVAQQQQQQQQPGQQFQQQQQGQPAGPPPPQQHFQHQPGVYRSGPPSGSQLQLGLVPGVQPGPGPVLMQNGPGGPVYFVPGPGGAPAQTGMQQGVQLPPGLAPLQGLPVPQNQQGGGAGMSGPPSGNQMQQQMGQQQQQQLGGRQGGRGWGRSGSGQQQQHQRGHQGQGGRGPVGRSSQSRGGKHWQLQRAQQQGQGQEEQGQEQQGQGGRGRGGGHGRGRLHQGGRAGNQKARGHHKGRGRG